MGFNPDPSYKVQGDLYTGISGGFPNDFTLPNVVDTINTYMNANATVPNLVFGFIGQYTENNPLPKTIDAFAQAMISYINTNGAPVIPLTNANIPAIKTLLRDVMAKYILLKNPTPPAGQVNYPDEPTMTQVAATGPLAPHTTLFDDIYDQAFSTFLAGFDFTTPSTSGQVPTIVSGVKTLNIFYFEGKRSDFTFHFATLVPNLISPSTGDTFINFQEIYEAFFGTNPSAFQSFLAGFINQQLYEKGENFMPNADVGEWLKQVQQAYALALTGSAGPLISSVGATTRKTDILDTILRLIIKMVGTLQRLAAIQSDRLRILSDWENAYTELQSKVPVFTAGDGSIFSVYGDTQTRSQAKDDANNYNQTLTETIRSRRTIVDNDAKSLQNNLNQSNDSANQQADAGTQILTKLSTLLSAIYR